MALTSLMSSGWFKDIRNYSRNINVIIRIPNIIKLIRFVLFIALSLLLSVLIFKRCFLLCYRSTPRKILHAASPQEAQTRIQPVVFREKNKTQE